MKTMTCRQMGGPCDAPIHGATADEMMNNGAVHVNEMAATGDEAHKQVQTGMKAMQENPESGKEWNEKFMKDFAAQPED